MTEKFYTFSIYDMTQEYGRRNGWMKSPIYDIMYDARMTSCWKIYHNTAQSSTTQHTDSTASISP